MEDDKRTADWATREVEKDQSEAREATEAMEKCERDTRIKDEGWRVLFKKLHAWMEEQAKSYRAEIPTKAFEVGKIERSGGPDSHDFFKVSHTNRERQPMKISYRDGPHEITVECGTLPHPRYLLSVEDTGDLFFKTSKGESKTIESAWIRITDLLERCADVVAVLLWGKAVRRFLLKN